MLPLRGYRHARHDIAERCLLMPSGDATYSVHATRCRRITSNIPCQRRQRAAHRGADSHAVFHFSCAAAIAFLFEYAPRFFSARFRAISRPRAHVVFDEHIRVVEDAFFATIDDADGASTFHVGATMSLSPLIFVLLRHAASSAIVPALRRCFEIRYCRQPRAATCWLSSEAAG